MNEYTLTIDDLEQGKEYLRQGRIWNNHKMPTSNVIFYINDAGVLKIKDKEATHHASIAKGDLFKEIKKEVEFKILTCYKAEHSGEFVFGLPSTTVSSNYIEQDYKIEDGQLLVRDIS